MATIDGESDRSATMACNPATGETIAQRAEHVGAEEVDEAVERAKEALPEWLDATPNERAELLLKLADVIDDNAEELAQIESRNVGKPLMASRDEMPFSRRQPPLLRRRGAQPRGQVARASTSRATRR